MNRFWGIILLLIIITSCVEVGLAKDDYYDDNKQTSSLNSFLGKKILIVGGSVAFLSSVYGSDGIIEEYLQCEVSNLAIGGAGYSKGTEIINGIPSFAKGSIPEQINLVTSNNQAKYDIYIFWSSTNDLWYCTAGEENDYTNIDNYDVEKLKTQCGGMNYCIKRVQEFAPESQIVIIGSCKAFGLEKILYDKFEGMVHKQELVANRASIPFFSLWDNSSFNEFNRNQYFYHGLDDLYYTSDMIPYPHGDDGVHPNEEGYKRIAYKITEFIVSNIEP